MPFRVSASGGFFRSNVDFGQHASVIICKASFIFPQDRDVDLPLDPVAGPAEVLLPKPDAPSGAPHAAQFDDEDELDSAGVVAPSGAPHADQFDEEDDLDDRPGLTS